MLSRLTSCGSWRSRLTSALVSPQHATESLDTGGGTTDYAVCCLPTVSSLPPSEIILECDYHDRQSVHRGQFSLLLSEREE